MADDQGEKTEEPSAHKIEESRKKGDVASSKEVSSVFILAATFTALILSSVTIFEILSEYLSWLYGLEISKVYTKKIGQDVLVETLWVMIKCSLPVFVTSLMFGIISQVMQVGILFAPDVLQLKIERLNPLNGVKKLFSMRAIVEVIKGLFKFGIVLSVSYYVLKDQIVHLIGFLHAEPVESLAFGRMLAWQLAFYILMALVVVALGDFAWEKYSYRKKLRMTKQEVKEETKQKEGSPEVKQRIRSLQRQMATKRMAEDVANADVVVTNPTHLSVVLKYNNLTMVAPEVVAKGADHLAMRIREIAKENDIPIVENVPLARALYNTVKVGHGVPRTLYKAVAEILAFVYKKKRKKVV